MQFLQILLLFISRILQLFLFTPLPQKALIDFPQGLIMWYFVPDFDLQVFTFDMPISQIIL